MQLAIQLRTEHTSTLSNAKVIAFIPVEGAKGVEEAAVNQLQIDALADDLAKLPHKISKDGVNFAPRNGADW